MGFLRSYSLRLQRRRWRVRALRKRRQLTSIADKTRQIRPGDIIVFSTFRNEDLRLPYFLRYYRQLGVDHFIMVDNESTDGGAAYLADQPDVSLWTAKGSYKRARFGMDWLNYLQSKYGHGH